MRGHLLPCMLQLLAACRADPNHQSTSTGLSVLMVAASWNSPARNVAALLKAGANPKLVDFKGRSALFAAVRVGYADVVARLAAAGADVFDPRITAYLANPALHSVGVLPQEMEETRRVLCRERDRCVAAALSVLVQRLPEPLCRDIIAKLRALCGIKYPSKAQESSRATEYPSDSLLRFLF